MRSWHNVGSVEHKTNRGLTLSSKYQSNIILIFDLKKMNERITDS